MTTSEQRPPGMAPRMSRTLTATSAVIVICVVMAVSLAACGGGSTVLSTPPTTDDSLTLTTQQTPVGPILATGAGNTLYDFGPDTPHHSACVNDGCVYQWPPLIVSGAIRVGPGIRRALVGTLKRPNGSTQLSYAGHPLYTYTLDVKSGMVTGQAID